MGLPASKRWFLRTAFVFFQICFGGGSEYGGSLEPLAASSTRFFSAVDKLLQRHILGNLPKTETHQIKDIYKNGIKINLGNVERFWMPDGDSVEKRGGRVRRSYVARYPSVDKYDLTAPVPIDYILVVDLGIQVKDLNETALRWLEIAFATNLSLPLENVVTQKVGYHGNTVEMFFVRYGRPVTTFSIEDLIPVKEIISLRLLHTLQQTLPFLNITNIRPQQAILVTNEESEPLSSWFVSYFPYIAAACCVCIILMTTVLVYCCCCKKKKEPENDKGSQKLQQIYFPSVKPDMKDPKMIQPGGSPLYTPPGSITPVQTPTGRIKAKGLLERRGSNASLTIDLNASPESGRWDGTPPKESTGVEYLMTAGHRLSRQDLKNAVRNNRALHQEFWEIFTNHPEKVSVAGSGMKNRYRSIIPNEHSRVILPDIAITASPESNFIEHSGYIVKFSRVKTSIGISGMALFKTSGKFKCEYEGLYSVSILLNAYNTQVSYNIYLNGNVYAYDYEYDNKVLHQGGAITVIVNLHPSDMLSVQLFRICMSLGFIRTFPL
ncbi:PTPRR [Mytilus edulis]|uniref:protein-tyrosine-phosphatase n=1 Tax=Mytilus edulis TaxID=6550 RepID=A0A8S3QT56_MYTED|nr:PTPRR [Mytilus edulis]